VSPRTFIGTSGWRYPHWQGSFYPEDLPDDEQFAFYCDRFVSVEVNNTFYNLPDADAVRAWRETSPADFTFAVKASRYITHMKKFKDPPQGLPAFYRAVEPLGDKLGPVLFQLPPDWRADPDRLESFANALEPGRRHAFEFRDHSWITDDILDILRRHGLGFVVYHLAGFLAPKEVTADFAYVRLHGPGDAYQGSYDDKTLQGWAGTIEAWHSRGLDVYCYFDNDENGHAARNAARLNHMTGS
jgi:uncharacterized protein YecE (DUF72 family)